MPLVTVTTRAGKTPAWKRAVLDGVHRALVATGVPEADRFQRIQQQQRRLTGPRQAVWDVLAGARRGFNAPELAAIPRR